MKAYLWLLRSASIVAVLFTASLGVGFVATQNHWKLAEAINEIRLSFIDVWGIFARPEWLEGRAAPYLVRTVRPDEAEPGLIMVAGIDGERRSFVRVIDRQGTVLHEWLPDWFEIWKDPPDAIPANRLPNRRPAALLHGVRILDDGDIVLNWEFLSTMRLSPCGKVRWKLANLGHHSVNIGDDKTIYVGAERFKDTAPTGFDNQLAPLNSYAVEQIDMDGNILKFKEVLEILRENDLLGLMHLSTQDPILTMVSGDTMHMNDVEVYPKGMPSSLFRPGDIMISLRNIATILVVDPVTWRVKFRSTGQVNRQHDVDFLPNDRIAVFDNRNMNDLLPEDQRHSRVVEINALTGRARVLFQGSDKLHFYTPTLGRQTVFPSGNILTMEGWDGHVFEVNKSGDLIWEYYNIVDATHTGVVTEAELLPPGMDRAFFERLTAECGA